MLARVFIVASAAAVDAEIVDVLTDDDVVTVDETKKWQHDNKSR